MMADLTYHNQTNNDYTSGTKQKLCAKLFLTLSFTAALTLTSANSIAAELVIISTTGDDFKAGQIINSTSNIKLAKGESIALISENGKLVTLNGPYSGPVQINISTVQTGSLLPTLKKIVTGSKTESSSLGVMRSIGGSIAPPDPWSINSGKGGKYCISLAKPVILWRARSLDTSKLILLNTENGKEVRTVWHAGQSTLFWPRLQPLVDGATYRIDLSGESRLPKITLVMVPDLPTQAHAAVWMADNGCGKQALQIIKSLGSGGISPRQSK